MALNVGINVQEVDGRAAPAIQPASTSVAAFLGLTERGLPNRPVRITDLQQFRDRFGAHRTDGFLAYAIEGFFQNGGRTAYVTRIVGTPSAAAFLTLNNRQAVPAPSLRISAGYRGQLDPGPWGERLRLDVRDDPRGRTTVPGGAAAGAISAVLASLDGFQIGRVVRFVDGANTFYRRITGVVAGTSTVQWSAAAPIAPGLNVGVEAATAEFRLIVRYLASPTGEFTVAEDWRRLSLETDTTDYAVDRINHPNTGSKFITALDVTGGALSGEENPAVASNQAPTAGTGTETLPGAPDYAGDEALRTGLHALDTSTVELVAIPDAHRLTPAGRAAVVTSALTYCAGRGDCMFIGSAPDRVALGVAIPRSRSDYTQLVTDYLTAVKTYSAPFQAAKVYGALYAPWIRVLDPLAGGPNPARFIPADGHLMGVYARTDLERGIFKAPAGNAALARGALDVAAVFSDVEHTDLVQNGLVNGIRHEPGLGITVAASRTLSTDTRWWFVNVRLLFNFVKSSLKEGLRFVRQEPHTEELRRTVRLNVVTPFLLGLWRQGAFGSGPPQSLFSIKCDAENNPPTQVDLGNFTIEVYFYPVKPAETILIIVGQQPSGATAAEA